MIYSKASQLIGNTPCLKLSLNTHQGIELLLKMEKFNPGQSMKDRMAISMIKAAENSGKLKRGGIIVESSSGNTGTGLAMLAAEMGYRFIAVVDHHAAKDKIAVMQAYGAEIVHVNNPKYSEDQVAVKERETTAAKIASQNPNAVFLQQADNPANANGYYHTLGNELILDTKNSITHLIGSIGTGGSLCGTARRLKDHNSKIMVIGVEPVGSVIFGGEDLPYYQSGTGNPGSVEIGKNVDYVLIDQGLKVPDAAAFTTARFMAKKLGILIGGAAGGVVFCALKYLEKLAQDAVMVAIIADGGEKYLNTVFNDAWIEERDLHDQKTQTFLDRIIKVKYE